VRSPSGGRERGDFSDSQIELLKTFAEQAVIAITSAETYRALQTRTADLQQSLEYQTATSDVLKVINRSTFDLQAVLDTLVETAARLCDADFGALSASEGETYRVRATFALVPEFDRILRGQLFSPSRATVTGRVLLERQTVHIPDALADPELVIPESVTIGRLRTMLGVPLLREGEPIGVFVLSRKRVEPFTARQIELVRTFADQGMIAIENTRLLTELREALEQQTATAEVLRVINASPGDLAPVFDTILEKAHTLCGAEYGVLLTYDGELFWPVAVKGERVANSDSARRGIRPGFGFGKLVRGERLLHIHDMTQVAADLPDDPVPRALFEISGIRTQLAVPLRRDDKLLGIITANRREVRPFSEREIALLENFAAQAVIAMENARLLNEQREALEQQTATTEVLQVINSSPGNLVPVFSATLESATRLCDAAFGILWLCDGEQFYATALHGAPERYAEVARVPHRPHPNNPLWRMLRGERFFVSLDVAAEEPYRAGDPNRRALVDLGGARSVIQVALVNDDVLLGSLTVYRQEVRPFSDKQIALLKNFAAQAVIAIENARLLGELRERTDELTRSVAELQALEEVLRAVNSSLDLDTVLATIVGRAAQLSQADEGTIYEFDETEEVFVPKSAFGMSAERVEVLRERRIKLGETHLGRSALQRAPVYVPDVQQDPSVPHAARNLPGIHAVLAVPLLRQDKVVGGLVIRRRSEAGFAPTIPTLLQTFAGQAVLAIENARLFQEARRARTAAETALVDLHRAQDRLVQSEKMASLGQLTAGIAHEIKNPLNFVNNFAALSVDLLAELKETAAPGFAALTEEQRGEIDDVSAMLTSNLEKITEHGKRADGIVKAMLEHSRGSSGERRMVDLSTLIDEALNLAYHGARAQDQTFNITLERDFGEGIALIEVNPQDITRVFLNIFSNGFYATTRRARDGGDAEFVPTLKVTTRDDDEAVEIRVRDNGTGIPADIKDKLFQPFFTTKPTGDGTGLGLSITYDIVTQQHGGSIAVTSIVGEYSEFTIRLPRNP
jgi:GAF domain-containing protein